MKRPDLTPVQRRLVYAVTGGGAALATIGFAGSYAAVRKLAEAKGFGLFAVVFPIGIDAGIAVLLALDLLLTWVRMPYPVLRPTAWVLTVATVAFNAAAAWPDPVGVSMHAVIPVLFVVIVEAARHAIGRGADITADRHIEPVRLIRWVLAPVPTFKLWRRMKLWELRSYGEVIRLEQERLIYRARLQMQYGRAWRWKAPVEDRMPLRLTRYGRALIPVERAPEPAALGFDEVARQAIAVASEQQPSITEHHRTPPAEHPAIIANTAANTPANTASTVREQIANKAVTSPNTDRDQPSIAAVVREHVANTTTNPAAIAGVMAVIPAANEKSVAAAVRRERRRTEMKGGYN